MDDRPAEPGHVFVVRGDLTKLVCDHVLVTTDRQMNVGHHWEPLLPPELIGPSGYSAAPLRVKLEFEAGSRVAQVPFTGDIRQPWMVITGAGGRLPAEWVAASIAEALDAIRSCNLPTVRDRPLVALPLPGTGAGGLAGRRGEVIARLLPELRRQVSGGTLDVALVLADDADWAAVQAGRAGDDFAGISESQLPHLARLADHAARGELSLFLGAGISLAAGLPSWASLIDELAEKAGLDPVQLRSVSPPDAAQVASDALGDAFVDLMKSRFTREHYTLAHGLLASLRVRQAVTTNYDTCYELAAGAVFPAADQLRVLPLEHSHGTNPWLLKLHGDIKAPGSIVLTRKNYLDLADRGVPLTGMVQSLLLTGHVLFVGYSLSDENVIRLAHQVRNVLATSGLKAPPMGTLLPLFEDEIRRLLWKNDLHHVPMATRTESVNAAAAARRLEIFLDALAWRASAQSVGSERYLLDPRYEAVHRADSDRALQQAVKEMIKTLPPEARHGRGWRVLQAALEQLGAG